MSARSTGPPLGADGHLDADPRAGMELRLQTELSDDRGEVVMGVGELKTDLRFLVQGAPVTRHPFLLSSRL